MKKLCLLLTAYCLLVISCKQKTDHSHEISRLDSASAITESAEKFLLSVDTVSLRATYNIVQQDLNTIMTKISSDTVQKKTALFLAEAYDQVGSIINLLSNKKFLEKAMNDSRKQISDLKHDLAEDLIEKNKSGAYIVNEINASAKISDATNRAVQRAKEAVVKLDSLKTRIVSFADSLRAK